jgi:hypothetical protein
MGGKTIEEKMETLRGLNSKYMHIIWQVAKAGDLESLSGEARRLATIMLEHEEYHQEFEIADHLQDHEYDVDRESNPFLHIAIHAVVENQLEARDPIEVNQFFNAMRKHAVPRHDIVHMIGAILAPLIFDVKQEGQPFDLGRYARILKKCKTKRPYKVWDAIESAFD